MANPENIDPTDGFFGTYFAADRRQVVFFPSELVLGFKYNFSLVVVDLVTGLSSAPTYRTSEMILFSLPIVSLQVPPVLYRPVPTTIVAQVIPSTCSPPFDTSAFKWIVSPAIGGLSAASLTMQNLYIPAQYLLPSVSYHFTLYVNVRTGASNTLVDVTSAPIAVIPSPLVAAIKGGDRAISIDSPLVIDASKSHDPDAPTVIPPVTWLCRNLSQYAEVATCFFDSPPPVGQSSWLDTRQLILTFPPYTLRQSERYLFQLVLAQGTSREASSLQIVVEVHPRPEFPNPIVTIAASDLLVVNHGSPIRIAASAVSGATGTSSTSLTYDWSELLFGLNMTDPSTRSSALGVANLVVRPSATIPETLYRFRLTVTDTAKPENALGGQSFAEVYAYVNVPPSGGQCRLVPKQDASNPVANAVSILCTGWNDPNLPLSYQFAWYKNSSSQVVISSQQGAPSLDTFLPFGDVIVVAFIFDGYNARSRFEFPVTIPMPSTSSDPISLIESILGMAAISLANSDSGSDMTTISNAQQTVASLLVATNILNENTNGSTVDRLLLRSQVINTISVLSNVSSVTLQQIVNMIEQVTNKPAELDPADFRRVVTLLTTVLTQPERTQGLDDTTATNIVTSASNVANNYLRTGNCTTLAEVQDLMRDLLALELSRRLSDEESSTYSTGDILATTQLLFQSAANFGDFSMPTGDALSAFLNGSYSVSLMRFKNITFCMTDCAHSASNFLSDLTTAEVSDGTGVRDINGLAPGQSINFTIPVSSPITPDNSYLIRCKWYVFCVLFFFFFFFSLFVPHSFFFVGIFCFPCLIQHCFVCL